MGRPSGWAPTVREEELVSKVTAGESSFFSLLILSLVRIKTRHCMLVNCIINPERNNSGHM
jgi:hypothetical protein